MLCPWVPSNPVTHMPSLGPRPHGPMPHRWWWGSEEMPGCPVHADMNGNEWLSCEPCPQSEAWFQGFWVIVYGQFLEFLVSTVQNCVPKEEKKKAWESDRHSSSVPKRAFPSLLTSFPCTLLRAWRGGAGQGLALQQEGRASEVLLLTEVQEERTGPGLYRVRVELALVLRFLSLQQNLEFSCYSSKWTLCTTSSSVYYKYLSRGGSGFSNTLVLNRDS